MDALPDDVGEADVGERVGPLDSVKRGDTDEPKNEY
jgi:hypothetical protein